jgi:hypothetical protein
MHRLLAIIERDLRRFKANPMLVFMSLMIRFASSSFSATRSAARSGISRSASSITTATCPRRT